MCLPGCPWPSRSICVSWCSRPWRPPSACQRCRPGLSLCTLPWNGQTPPAASPRQPFTTQRFGHSMCERNVETLRAIHIRYMDTRINKKAMKHLNDCFLVTSLWNILFLIQLGLSAFLRALFNHNKWAVNEATLKIKYGLLLINAVKKDAMLEWNYPLLTVTLKIHHGCRRILIGTAHIAKHQSNKTNWKQH